MGDIRKDVEAHVKKMDRTIADAQKGVKELVDQAVNQIEITKKLKENLKSQGNYMLAAQCDDVQSAYTSDCRKKTSLAQALMDAVFLETQQLLDKIIKEKKESNYDSVVHLINKMNEWKNLYPTLSIIKPEYGWEFHVKLTEKVKSLIRACEDEYLNDPIIKKEEYRRRKDEYLSNNERDKKRIAQIQDELKNTETELSSKKDSFDSDVEFIINDIKNKTVGLDHAIEEKESELEQKEDKLRLLNNELDGLGIFAISKKKNLKSEIASADENVRYTRNQLLYLEKEKENTINSKDIRINGLNSYIESLNKKIKDLTSEKSMLEENVKKTEQLIAEFG